MHANVRHTDRKMDKDHTPTLRLAPENLPPKGSKVEGPFPGNVCGQCDATVEIVNEKRKFG